MTPVIVALLNARIPQMRRPSKHSELIRSKVQETVRRCANKYWLQLNVDIQTAAVTGNIRGTYDGTKKALGPLQNKTAPSNPLVVVSSLTKASRETGETLF